MFKNLSLLCNHIAKEWLTRPISSLHVNINVVQYRGKKKKYINVVLFGFSIFWKTAMMFMWCIVFQLVAIIKKKNQVAEDPFPHDNQTSTKTGYRPSRNSKLNIVKLLVKAISASPPPACSPQLRAVLDLWDRRLFHSLSRLTPIINLTYSHQHGSYRNRASSAS